MADQAVIAIVVPPPSGVAARVMPPPVVHALVDAPPLITARISVNQGPSGPQGPIGPQGEPAPPTSFYAFTQSEPASEWVILHNMGKMPHLTVIDVEGDTVDGDIRYDSIDQLTLVLSTPLAGVAYCG